MNIEDELILFQEAYSNNIAQRVLMSNIPCIGSSIDNLFTGKPSKYYKQRIETVIYLLTLRPNNAIFPKQTHFASLPITNDKIL